MPRPHTELLSAKLKHLRPTQMTLGFREVRYRRRIWKSIGKQAREHLLASHWFPAVRAPDGHFYIVDHHHLGRALLEEDVAHVKLILLKNLSKMPTRDFWTFMDHHQWVHPYNATGRRCAFASVPNRLEKLTDDPYRSLAAEVRRHGGFAKEIMPYAEFLWANYYRGVIPQALLQHQWRKAMAQAMALAHSGATEHLPGWSGVMSKGLR